MRKLNVIKQLVSSSCAFAVTVSFSTPAFSETVIEELVVTAQKREQTIAEVPISVQSFDSGFLEAAGIDDLTELSLIAPNLNFLPGVSRDNLSFNIRGLSSDTGNAGIDPSVGFFIDGVYVAQPAALLSKLTDIERIEVLRGPQGTLYGRNTSVGAVNIITKDPGEEFEANFKAIIGNLSTEDIRARIAGPLSDNLAASLSGYWSNSDIHTDNLVTGGAVGEIDDYGFRIKTSFTPSDTLSFEVIGDYTNSEADGSVFDGNREYATPFTFFSLLGFLPAPPIVPISPFDRNTEHTPGVEFNNFEEWGLSLQADWDLGFATLTSVTGYRDTESNDLIDVDSVAANLALAGEMRQIEQFTEELRLASNKPVMGFDYLLGFYYFDSDFNLDDQQTRFPAFEPGIPQFLNTRYQQKTESYAAFGQLTYEVNDALSFIYGFRASSEEKTAIYNQAPDPLFAGGFIITLATLNNLSPDKYDEDSFTQKASVNYEFSNASNVYFTYSEGFKSGGFNGTLISPGFLESELRFQPEESTNYEIGYRGLIGDTFRFSTAAYYIEFDELQISRVSIDSGVAAIIVDNAAEAEVYGFEFEGFWNPMAGLDFNGSLAYNKAEYKNTVINLSPGLSNPSAPAAPVDLSGRTLPRAPEWSAALGAQYEWPVSDSLKAMVRADYSYSSDFFVSASLRDEAFVDAYSLVNFRAGIGAADDRWNVAVWVKNAFDEDYITQSIENPASLFEAFNPTLTGIPTNSVVVNPPVTFGVELSYNFGG